MNIKEIKAELKEALSKTMIQLEEYDMSDVSEEGGEHLSDIMSSLQVLLDMCQDDVDLSYQSSEDYYDSGC